jgi:hypothetical protein
MSAAHFNPMTKRQQLESDDKKTSTATTDFKVHIDFASGHEGFWLKKQPVSVNHG